MLVRNNNDCNVSSRQATHWIENQTTKLPILSHGVSGSALTYWIPKPESRSSIPDRTLENLWDVIQLLPFNQKPCAGLSRRW